MKLFPSFAGRLMTAVLPLILAGAGQVRASSYDPLAVDPAFHPARRNMRWCWSDETDIHAEPWSM
jgi:hypothetical protein